MTTISDRKTKRADELVVGDWLTRPGGWPPVPLLAVVPFETKDSGPRVQAIYRGNEGRPQFWELRIDAEVSLATPTEVAAVAKSQVRAQFVAGLREFADWVEANPWAPIMRDGGYMQHVRLQIDLNPNDEADGAADVARVREIADRLGAKVDESLDDRTVASIEIGSASYSVVAWHRAGRPADLEPVDDPTGLLYQREADDPTPVSPARGTLQTGAVTDDGLVEEAEPTAEHYETGGWVNDGPGGRGVECACGVTFDGFDSLAEAGEQLALHIEAATSPTGLTRAADQSRGVLAGTTPVVTYFSFGHGQSDPATGQNLLDHYVTVVAPTYEACREAMFASRFGRAWSFDYLAGTPRATKWIPRWTEYEVIVAPDTDSAAAEAALKAARELLNIDTACEAL